MEEVLLKARRHSTNAKKMFLITPQRAKGRRWFLFDLLNNIIPHAQDVLLEFVRLLQSHGEENVKFPLFMFREQEMHEGERTLHPGNLIDIVDQIKFFFAQSPNDLVGVNSAYIKDLDERMKALSAREFTGYEGDLSTSSSSTLSSDDEPDTSLRYTKPDASAAPLPQPPTRIPSTAALGASLGRLDSSGVAGLSGAMPGGSVSGVPGMGGGGGGGGVPPGLGAELSDSDSDSD